jgi:hypothetical protein
MDMKNIIRQTKKQLTDTTGLKAEGVTQAFRDEQGWHVRVNVLEMSRIPPATDVLGDYEILLDDEGSMLKFERKRTRLRGDLMEEESVE